MKPIWHLFYKEWIKTRTAFFCSLLVGVGVVFYIFIGVENKITLMGAKNYTLNILYSNPPVIYYSLLRYLPLLAAVSIGISQYVPEVAQRRIRLTLHLPVGNRTLFIGMAFYGLLVITIFNAIVLGFFLWKNSFIFPSEVTIPVRHTVWGWFLAGYWVYNYISFTALEPNRLRQLFYALTGLIVLSLYFYDVPFHGAYGSSTPVLALLALLSCPLILFSGYRLNKGER